MTQNSEQVKAIAEKYRNESMSNIEATLPTYAFFQSLDGQQQDLIRSAISEGLIEAHWEDAITEALSIPNVEKVDGAEGDSNG